MSSSTGSNSEKDQTSETRPAASHAAANPLEIEPLHLSPDKNGAGKSKTSRTRIRFLSNPQLKYSISILVVAIALSPLMKRLRHLHQVSVCNNSLSELQNMARKQQQAHQTGQKEPNPPVWPDSVKIFYPHNDPNDIMASIKETEDSTSGTPATYNCSNHFTDKRWALLFAPGDYKGVDFEVGYYVQVAGLGTRADDVEFQNCDKGPFVPALNKFQINNWQGSGLDTFWRSAENFATSAGNGMHWVVSQAAPLRRVHIKTNLAVSEGGAYVSGGFLANALVEGYTEFGGQQQWISRNVHFEKPSHHGAWSLVFCGCTGKDRQESNGILSSPSVTVDKVPRVRVEKPFVALQQEKDGTYGNRFVLRVPPPTRGTCSVGPDLEGAHDDVRDFSRVKVGIASNNTDEVAAGEENHKSLQNALDEGKDVVLAPGIYYLSSTLSVDKPHQVILGLGLATLVAPADGSPCIRVEPNTPGVRIAGLMLEASVLSQRDDSDDGSSQSVDGVASLLEWGSPDNVDEGDSRFPGVLTDIFARVGGSNPDRSVSTDVMVRIHSGNVVGDNLWLWRADHVKLREDEEANFPNISPYYWQVVKDECKVRNGLVVNGNNVTIHGLFVEHTEEHQTIWNGENGNVRFYQCELPYDVDEGFANRSFVGYKVGDHVDTHSAYALGVYSNFRDYEVQVRTAIEHPEKPSVIVKNPFTVKLDNKGLIRTIVNGRGPGPEGHPFRYTDN